MRGYGTSWTKCCSNASVRSAVCWRIMTSLSNAMTIALVLFGTGCQQDAHRGRPDGAIVQRIRQSELLPGPASPVRTTADNPYEGDEEAIARGKQLFSQFNCAGCHAAGGGAIGPPLMDEKWIYGSSSANIFSTIVEGRPQGMPAFGGRISEEQVWRLAAYVRSLSGIDKKEAEEKK